MIDIKSNECQMSFKKKIEQRRQKVFQVDVSKHQLAYEALQNRFLDKVEKYPYEKEHRISTIDFIPNKMYSQYIDYITKQLEKEGIVFDLDEYGGITITV